MATFNGSFSLKQRFAQAFCESSLMVGVVLLLVTLHVVTVAGGHANEPFELFMTFFFITEVSGRIWAHTPYYFFFGYERRITDMQRWMNCADFCLSLFDIAGMIMKYCIEGDGSLSQGAKAGRITRIIKVFKLFKMVRMWRVVKMFVMVFARERDTKVMQRRKKVTLQLAENTDWRIDRATTKLSTLNGMMVDGLDLANENRVQVRKHRLYYSIAAFLSNTFLTCCFANKQTTKRSEMGVGKPRWHKYDTHFFSARRRVLTHLLSCRLGNSA
jgi:hypothetical protein